MFMSNFSSRETKQYADNTVMLSSHDEVLKCKDEPEKAIEKCIHFFKIFHLKINQDTVSWSLFRSLAFFVALILKTKRN